MAQKVRYLVKTWTNQDPSLGLLETWLNEGAKAGADLFSLDYHEDGKYARAVCVFTVPLKP